MSHTGVLHKKWHESTRAKSCPILYRSVSLKKFTIYTCWNGLTSLFFKPQVPSFDTWRNVITILKIAKKTIFENLVYTGVFFSYVAVFSLDITIKYIVTKQCSPQTTQLKTLLKYCVPPDKTIKDIVTILCSPHIVKLKILIQYCVRLLQHNQRHCNNIVFAPRNTIKDIVTIHCSPQTTQFKTLLQYSVLPRQHN